MIKKIVESKDPVFCGKEIDDISVCVFFLIHKFFNKHIICVHISFPFTLTYRKCLK
jgi:hypothetical protein